MRHSITAFSLSTALLVVLSLISTGVAQAAPSKAEGKARHARIVEYWTPARMAHAKPRDFVKTDRGFAPAAKGGKRGGGGDSGGESGGGAGTVTGASWNDGGDVLEGTGKVYFTMAGVDYTCSGAVVQDPRTDYSLVLTAGHCAYDETSGAPAARWMFIPGYDTAPTSKCDATTYGCWTAAALVAHAGYAGAGSFNTKAIKHDWAFAVVGGGGLGGNTQLDVAVGDFGIAFDAPNAARYAFGYPAQGKYGGGDLVYCAGDVISDSGTGGATWGLACDMTPGSSGGPWFKGFDASSASGRCCITCSGMRSRHSRRRKTASSKWTSARRKYMTSKSSRSSFRTTGPASKADRQTRFSTRMSRPNPKAPASVSPSSRNLSKNTPARSRPKTVQRVAPQFASSCRSMRSRAGK